jgi:hypothetical protein
LTEIHLPNSSDSVERSAQRLPGDQSVVLIDGRLTLTVSRFGVIIIGFGDRVFFHQILVSLQTDGSPIPLRFGLMELCFFLSRIQTNQQITRPYFASRFKRYLAHYAG